MEKYVKAKYKLKKLDNSDFEDVLSPPDQKNFASQLKVWFKILSENWNAEILIFTQCLLEITTFYFYTNKIIKTKMKKFSSKTK